MLVTSGEIFEKEIINTVDGSSLGFAGEVLFDTETQKIIAITIKGRQRFFGLLGREEDFSVGWEKIETIGKDIILVRTERYGRIYKEKLNIFQKFLNIFFY